VTERILIAEHDDRLREAMCVRFGLEGYHCEPVADGQAAVRFASAHLFDLVVMDIAIPLSDGLNTCWKLRASLCRRVPILLIANDANEDEALLALEQCADDYMVRPLRLREFLARGRALIRRSGMHASPLLATTAPSSEQAVFRQGLVIDLARRRVEANGHDVKLTEHEFQLLYRLAAQAGVVFGRDALLSHIWGSGTFVTSRSVDALVKRVRRRLETAAGSPRCLVTVRGVGYKFEEHTQTLT
jgi:DNA-binding response OmpR family regulator